MRNIFSIHLTPEQHEFLRDQDILEAVALTQECLHSIHARKINVALLKIYLKKSYDCIHWGFLRCLLAKIGLDSKCSKWIIACVVDVNYAVLINGIPTSFFSAARGLRQCCSLSPILFILVMDSLSLHNKMVVHEKRCRPVAFSRDISISHNLFVDDILLSAMLCKASWICLHDILGRFQKAMGMCINKGKSSFHVENIQGDLISFLSQLFNIKAIPINEDLKYLCYQLKPVGYSSADWTWIQD